MEHNNVTNIEIYQYGIASGYLKTNFVRKPFHNGGSGAISGTSQENEVPSLINDFGEITPVELIPFDSLSEKFNIQKIALLKMDCEGEEYDIIPNSKYFAKDKIERIVGEVHPDKDNGESFKKISFILENEFSGNFRMDCYQSLAQKYNDR